MAAVGWSSLTLLVCLLVIAPATSAQETGLEDTQESKKLEQTVMKDMLRIVDHKFDTLSKRITDLERNVANLQFFSIRHFRQLGGAIKSTEGELTTVGKQVGQLVVDGRGSKISLSVLKRQVSELKTNTNYLFGELETSVTQINENMDKQTEVLKAIVQDTTLKTTGEATKAINAQLKQELDKVTSHVDAINCSVDFSPVNIRTDRRMADLKSDIMSQFSSLVQEIKQERASRECVPKEEEGSSAQSSAIEHGRGEGRGEHGTTKTVHRPVPLQQSSRPEFREDAQGSSPADLEEQDKMVMKALYNMTDNVMQAVGYFKQTGRMLEHLMTNSDLILSKQTDLDRRLRGLGSSGGTVSSSSSGSSGSRTRVQFKERPLTTRNSNDVPVVHQRGRKLSSIDGSAASEPVKKPECGLSEVMVNNLANVFKNGSQLLEVLTNLAEMSSMSMNQALQTLQDEIKQVETVRVKMTSSLVAKRKDKKVDLGAELANTTERIYKLTEAVAANTGYVPNILRHVQYAESQNNRSHQRIRNNNDLLRDIYRWLSKEAKERRSYQDPPTVSNTIPSIPQGEITGSQGHLNVDSTEAQDGHEMVLDKDSLETIFRTSLQLNRIMPALTKLLAEPDPLFTLVGGGRPDQGRLDIYHNAEWGAYCQDELTHPEADVICRHLGFKGGISAGPGFFGAGAGLSWSLNTSCLNSNVYCPSVFYQKDAAPCSHDEDAGVICDHMLRIAALNGSKDSKTGRLEIHHRGEWLPVCGDGWSGYEARVACQQMGYPDGRGVEVGEWLDGAGSRWMHRVACNGTENRLDACRMKAWSEDCPGYVPAGVRCQ